MQRAFSIYSSTVPLSKGSGCATANLCAAVRARACCLCTCTATPHMRALPAPQSFVPEPYPPLTKHAVYVCLPVPVQAISLTSDV